MLVVGGTIINLAHKIMFFNYDILMFMYLHMRWTITI